MSGRRCAAKAIEASLPSLRATFPRTATACGARWGKESEEAKHPPPSPSPIGGRCPKGGRGPETWSTAPQASPPPSPSPSGEDAGRQKGAFRRRVLCRTSRALNMAKNARKPFPEMPPYSPASDSVGRGWFLMSLIASRSLIVETASRVSPEYLTSYNPCRFDGSFTPSRTSRIKRRP